jgi:hypothetical protein
LDGTLYNRDAKTTDWRCYIVSRMIWLTSTGPSTLQVATVELVEHTSSTNRGSPMMSTITHSSLRDWNTLPATVADAGSLEDFHLRLQATH